MTVRFIGNAGISLARTLWGQPFPPPEIQALWNMIEVDIVVMGSAATKTFFLQRLDAPRRFGRTSLESAVAASRALDYDAWVEAIGKLL